ncbi:MAG: DUF4363 family protein [Clostridia bacterium]|nr:DUF4363 family protein [Clostridia bacterium]
MKALSAGVIMLIAVLALIWCGVSFLHGYTEDFEAALYEAQENYISGDRDAALESIRRLKIKEDGARDVLCMMIDHSEVAQVDMSILRLMALCKSDDKKGFETEISVLRVRVNNMYASERLSWANVL